MLDRPECQKLLKRLEKELPSHLRYHTVAHTLDVYHQAQRIAASEGVEGEELRLLLVAAVYHDAGYLVQRQDHEEVSCAIANENLKDYDYSDADIQKVCDIIMATKLPHQPRSLLEKIICDADMDYLGREDFFETGRKLYEEMLHAGIVANEQEWNNLQIEFLEKHQYFTGVSKSNRDKTKAENLNKLKANTKFINERKLL